MSALEVRRVGRWRLSSGRRNEVAPAAISAARLEETFRSSRPALIALALRITEERDVAEDIVQEAFTRLWERRGHWHERKRLEPLLFATVRNVALNASREKHTHVRAITRAPRQAAPAAPPELLAAAALEESLCHAIRELTPRARRVFVLRVCHGFSATEVAGRLGIGKQAVANHLTRARTRIRRTLNRGGWV